MGRKRIRQTISSRQTALSVLEPKIYNGTSVPSATKALTLLSSLSVEKNCWINEMFLGNSCTFLKKFSFIYCAVRLSVPGARPKPKSILPGYICAKVPNCSDIANDE